MQSDDGTQKRLRRTDSIIVGLIVAIVVAILALLVVVSMD